MTPGFTRIMERKHHGQHGGEGSPRWQMVEEKGITKMTPVLTASASRRLLAGDKVFRHGDGG